MHCRSGNKLDYRKMGLRCCALLLRISTLNSTLTVKILAMLNEKCTTFTPQKFLCFGWGGGATSTFIFINGGSMLFVEPVVHSFLLLWIGVCRAPSSLFFSVSLSVFLKPLGLCFWSCLPLSRCFWKDKSERSLTRRGATCTRLVDSFILFLDSIVVVLCDCGVPCLSNC